MRLSVVVTTYNHPEWLEKVLWGFEAQTFREFELLVADDGSDDRTRDLLARLAPRLGYPVRHIWHPKEGFRKCTILNAAIAQRAREALAGGEPSTMPGLVEGDLTLLTAATVFDAAQGGDELAGHVVRDTAKFLGIGVANFLNIFNPEVVVIAGGVTQAGEALFEPLRAEVRRRAFAPAVESCRIVPGELHGNAGVVGAVAIFAQARGLA